VLTAGGAYVPLDAGYPADRLAYMLADAGARILLVPGGGVEPPVAGASLTLEVAALAAERRRPGPSGTTALSPEQLCYVIYTSGSTGRPKGVALSHRSLANLVRRQLEQSSGLHGRTLQFAPLSFDVSFQEIFSTWSAGGTLVLVDDNVRREPAALLALLAREGIERLFLPFVALQGLAEAGAGAAPALIALRQVVTAGEQLRITPEIVRFFEVLPGCRLFNHYGPSETHVATSHRVSGAPGAWPPLPAIGRPLEGLAVRILDPELRPAALGAPGELCIAGTGVARGYLGRPRQTAEAFVPDPEAALPGARLYRSGDLARWDAMGRLHFLGRTDAQIKIRGYRIEPGEIESVLSGHPAVEQAAVVAFRHPAGDLRLAAFAVPAAGARVSPEGLVAFLKERLPPFMIPSALSFLPELPLTPSGKLDRRALPDPDWAGTPPDATDARPELPLEELIAGVWARVLGRERVLPGQDFFEIGGHSLLAAQVVTRLRESLGLEVPLRWLFEGSRVETLAARVQEALRAGSGAPALPRLAPAPDSGGEPGAPPLSYAQQRLWFLDRLHARGAQYNVPATFRLSGELSEEALRRSLEEITRRHRVLRATFGSREGRPVQRIAPGFSVTLHRIDLRRLPPAGREELARTLAGEEARRPFDLERGPLLRAVVLRLGERDRFLLLTLHHIVCDGWSIGILYRELAALYGAFLQGRSSPLPEPPLQYGDYARWQLAWPEELLEHQLDYWRLRLRELPVLRLGRGPESELRGERRGGVRTRLLPPELAGRVEGLARAEGATPFVVLLAAFVTALARTAGQTDLAVGTGTANRIHSLTESLIGFFVNTLVLRFDLGDDPAFRGLVAHVRETALEALAHQDVPFERVVVELQPDRDPIHNPLCRVMFVLQNFPLQPLALPGLTLSPTRLHSGTAKFDLVLFLEARDRGYLASAEYDAGVLEPTAVERFLRRFETLLSAVLEEPETRVVAAPILSRGESQLLLVEWNDTSRPGRDAAELVHGVVERTAGARPDAVAVSIGSSHLSYGELLAGAARLAAYLSGLGSGPERPVGVLAERSPELVVALLAVLRSGGAYVPLDPALPAERMELLIREAGVHVVLTAGALEGPPRLPCPVIDLSSVPLAADPAAHRRPAVTPDGLAYVLFTSGSTGKPKAVAVPHRGLMNLVRWTEAAFRLTPASRVSQVAAFGFDALGWEFWPALAAGGCVSIVDDDTRLSPAELREWLVTQRIEVSFVPTPLAELMLTGPWPSDALLRTLLVGGDRLSAAPQDPPGFEIINNYGPTESSVVSTSGRVAPDGAGAPAIGRPIDQARVYLVDGSLHPVPLGAPGELALGGPGLARGYRGRPALTAARFVPDPFREGERLYLSGDLGRFGDRGEIHFLGRRDRQVKVRGVRVEPAEVEAALLRHRAVAEVVVWAFEDPSGSPRLAAFVVPADEVVAGSREAERQRVEEWRSLYGDVYAGAGESAEPELEHVGWRSSYTGEPIPAEEMREWADAALARIQDLAPRRVLEIGCGTGMLLLPLAPRCESYVGVDFSKEALEYVRTLLRRRGLEDRVRLFERAADDLAWIEPGAADLVILNSVVQYFPGVEYLLRVLEQALAAAAPGGAVFLGDLRNQALLEAFHASLLLQDGPPDLEGERFRRLVLTRLSQEQELALAPDFFLALPERLPRIGHVDVHLKRGRHRNEMNRYRYDVVLHVGPQPPPSRPSLWRDWRREGLDLETLSRYLEDERPGALGLRGVPNARVLADAELLAAVEENPRAAVGDLWRSVRLRAERAGVEPDDLRDLGEALAYHVEIAWSEPRAEGAFDAVLRTTPPRRGTGGCPPLKAASGDLRALRSRANNPLHNRLAARLAPELEAHARRRLPGAMVPSAFVVLDSLPLTANGKVDHRALVVPTGAGVAAGEPEPPRGEVEAALARIWQEVLGVEPVGRSQSFFGLGGDSILSMQVVSRVTAAGFAMTPRDLFENQTVAELAEAVAGTAGGSSVTDTRPSSGEVPLLPAQHWFFELPLGERSHFNQSVLLAARERLEPGTLARAWYLVSRHHEALQARFERGRTGWLQRVPDETAPAPFLQCDLSALEARRAATEALERAAARVQASLDIERGPLARSVLFDLGASRGQRLLVAIHHLAVDGVSWRTLLADLESLYRQAAGGVTPTLPPRTSSFGRWSERLLELAGAPECHRDLGYWQDAAALGPGTDAPPDRHRGPNDLASARTVESRLEGTATRVLLRELPTLHRAGVEEILVAVLLKVLSDRWGGRTLWLDLESHGREDLYADIDLSRTVGWLTCIYPVRLELPAGNAPAILRGVKEQLHRVPNRGLPYAAARHLGPPEVRATLAALPRRRVVFNYLGQLDGLVGAGSLFGRAPESGGPLHGQAGERSHLLEINCRVLDGELSISWGYSENRHDRAGIERLAASYVEALRELAGAADSGDAELSPSDFPLTDLSQDQLDRILDRLPHLQDA
jgi:amino acid adenylation domain-containing protein/non-ribosomal peptide synthase protein (TIGR01720 family)